MAAISFAEQPASAWRRSPHTTLIVLAAVIAAYTALNIGANNIGHAIAETAGAILAGGYVVDTGAKDLIVRDHGLETNPLIAMMVAALLAAGLWLHLATYLGAGFDDTPSLGR